jgi:hypothetical protein
VACGRLVETVSWSQGYVEEKHLGIVEAFESKLTGFFDGNTVSCLQALAI